jgi:hypothetical protein
MKHLEDFGINVNMILKWIHIKGLRSREGSGIDSCG